MLLKICPIKSSFNELQYNRTIDWNVNSSVELDPAYNPFSERKDCMAKSSPT